jgi:glucokinase
MYLGVDIGGTKTLAAVLDDHGTIVEHAKFATPKPYDDFIKQLGETLKTFAHSDFRAATVAVPGQLDRQRGSVLVMSNLPWRQEHIEADVEALSHCPVIIENDANLAGLSEAKLLKQYDSVLYITVSTGIKTSLIYQQRLDRASIRGEGGHIVLPFKGKLARWEDFASGKAIYNHFGKKAADIPASDTKAWGYVARNLALGLYQHIAIIEPDVIVFGGSIGTYFNRYASQLRQLLKEYDNPMVKLPKLVQAQRPEEAVVYGCYDLAVQEFGRRATADR